MRIPPRLDIPRSVQDCIIFWPFTFAGDVGAFLFFFLLVALFRPIFCVFFLFSIQFAFFPSLCLCLCCLFLCPLLDRLFTNHLSLTEFRVVNLDGWHSLFYTHLNVLDVET
jgi:hypothetical protein